MYNYVYAPNILGYLLYVHFSDFSTILAPVTLQDQRVQDCVNGTCTLTVSWFSEKEIRSLCARSKGRAGIVQSLRSRYHVYYSAKQTLSAASLQLPWERNFESYVFGSH